MKTVTVAPKPAIRSRYVTCSTESIFEAAFAAVYFVDLELVKIQTPNDTEATFFFACPSQEKWDYIRQEFNSDVPVVSIRKYAEMLHRLKLLADLCERIGGILHMKNFDERRLMPEKV